MTARSFAGATLSKIGHAPQIAEERSGAAGLRSGHTLSALHLIERERQELEEELTAERAARLALEEELAAERAARLALEEEQGRLVAEFEAAMSTRDDFLSAAAHDLRTPLTALQLQVQGALRAAEREGLDARSEARFKSMGRQVRHLAELVDRLLDVSRVSSGHIDLIPSEMDLSELVRDVAERFAADLSWARCPLTISADSPTLGLWDKTRLDQVVTNLLSNAMKYGRGAPIEVAVYTEGESAKVSVRDHGIGIDEAEQARIFEKFHRAVTSETASGLGLGLWIVRHIVETCGGSITVESRPGEGSCFKVALPLSPTGR